MSLSKNVRRCRRCILQTRQLTENTSRDSRDGGESATAVTEKLSGSLNVLQKSPKMSMPNQWKFLTQIKDFFNKSGYEKNVNFLINKYWIDIFQRITYSQMESMRRLSSNDISKRISNNELKNEVTRKSVAVSLPEKKQQVNKKLEQEVKQPIELPSDIVREKDFKDQIYSLPQVLVGLMPKFGVNMKEKTFPIVPKWKKNLQRYASKHSILSRTKHVLNSIATAESQLSKLRRVEDLLTHIDQYPEARYHAIREGGIGILLRARQKINDKNTEGSIKEALAVLGYVDPLPGRGIRILSIDGGGIRGVLVIEMLKKLEQITGKKVHELFDYVCGVSTGAILSAVIGGHKNKSLDEVSELYKELSTKIFTQSTLKGTSNLVWSHAYYDTALWEEMLQEHVGDRELIKTARDKNTPKFSAISAIVNHKRTMAFVFRNYTLPHGVESQYMGSYKYKLWEAVRASAAAPSYFEEFKGGEFLHQDGGIMVNNPCAVAIHEAKQLWPNSPIQCVVSFGTGRTPFFISQGDSEEKEVSNASSWKDKFYKILDSATDTEAVHIMLNDLLPDKVYFRFNPYLTEMLTMVEIRPEKIAQLEQDAKMYIRRNEDKFQQAAKALVEKKPVLQKIHDWMQLHKKCLGA